MVDGRSGAGQAGLSLVEVLVAVAIASIIVVVLANALIASIRVDAGTRRNQTLSQALTTLADGVGVSQFVSCGIEAQDECRYVPAGTCTSTTTTTSTAPPDPSTTTTSTPACAVTVVTSADVELPRTTPAQQAYFEVLSDFVDDAQRTEVFDGTTFDVTSVRFWSPTPSTADAPGAGDWTGTDSSAGLAELTLSATRDGSTQTLVVLKRDPGVRA